MSEISVSYLTSARTTDTSSTSSTAGSDTLDKEAFLKLLVAQLSNQDPSSPMDSTQLMTQTTQLSSMESLTSIQDSVAETYALQARMAATALVGTSVQWTDADGVTSSGLVSGVTYTTTPTVSVDGQDVSLDDITSVTTA